MGLTESNPTRLPVAWARAALLALLFSAACSAEEVADGPPTPQAETTVPSAPSAQAGNPTQAEDDDQPGRTVDAGTPSTDSQPQATTKPTTTTSQTRAEQATTTSHAQEDEFDAQDPEVVPPGSLADNIVIVDGLLREPAVRHDRDTVPRLDLIDIRREGASDLVTLTGRAGASPFGIQDPARESFRVLVHNIEWDTMDCVERNEDGSFTASLEAPPGSTVYVMPADWGECQTSDPDGGAVLSLPRSGPTDSGSLDTHGLLGGSRPTRWSASGSAGSTAINLRLQFPEGPPEECIFPGLHLYRLFDGDGDYVTQVNMNVHGPVLTPTGLPIETDNGINGFYDVLEFDDVPRCLIGDVDLTVSDPVASLESGWYLPRMVFAEWWGDTTEGFGTSCPDLQPTPVVFECNTGYGFLPMIGVGEPEIPELPVTLLNQAASWGSAGVLGVVANEDSGRFALGSRRSAQAPFIASPRDPLSGRSLSYTLDPYLPTVGYTGFAGRLPQPLFTLDPDEPGNLTVSLTSPDGASRVLTDNARVQMLVTSGDGDGYPAATSFGGPSHTIGLTTFDDGMDVSFDQYGLHEVKVQGTLRSSRGDDFDLEGTYDIWVAEPLDLSLGVFEGTPLEVGDSFNPVVVVEPGVPADITINIAHYPNGDAERRQVQTISGKANEYGYFASTDSWEPTEHGEYRVDVTASYLDPVDGTLWMAERSSASIVATPDTPGVAHGRRNQDHLDREAGQGARTWYFFRSFDPECPPSSGDCDGGGDYPFFTGDVMWLTDVRPLQPTITVDSPADVLARVAPDLTAREKCGAGGCTSIEDELELVSSTSTGSGAHHRQDDVTSWAYWYSSSIRADVSVFHVATSFRSEHNSWYGTDFYNCQIGLPCFGALMGEFDEFNGDEQGDVKLMFGGAVIKTDDEQHFVPYASFASIIEGGSFEDGVLVAGDEKGDRICPPYQGAAGGLGTCGPILTHRGREVDLFITPTGTRPGSVLEPGDLFTFSGQAWPTLDVAVEVTVTGPDGSVHELTNRANTVGYVDHAGMSFVVESPGVYDVHVSATQDLPVPSTGLAPDPVFVADGRTTMDVYGYEHPLSAVLGTQDSTYRFYVVEGRADAAIEANVHAEVLPHRKPFSPTLTVEQIAFSYRLPDGVTDAHISLTAPGLVLIDRTVAAVDGSVDLAIKQQELNDAGFTQIILGADTLQLSIAYETADGWEAQILNQRGFSPLGGG